MVAMTVSVSIISLAKAHVFDRRLAGSWDASMGTSPINTHSFGSMILPKLGSVLYRRGRLRALLEGLAGVAPISW